MVVMKGTGVLLVVEEAELFEEEGETVEEGGGGEGEGEGGNGNLGKDELTGVAPEGSSGCQTLQRKVRNAKAAKRRQNSSWPEREEGDSGTGLLDLHGDSSSNIINNKPCVLILMLNPRIMFCGGSGPCVASPCRRLRAQRAGCKVGGLLLRQTPPSSRSRNPKTGRPNRAREPASAKHRLPRTPRKETCFQLSNFSNARFFFQRAAPLGVVPDGGSTYMSPQNRSHGDEHPITKEFRLELLKWGQKLGGLFESGDVISGSDEACPKSGNS